MQNIAQLLWNISMALRDIVCEILLRDIENLLEKYLIKTRKVRNLFQFYSFFSSLIALSNIEL